MNEFKPFEQPSKTKVAIVAGGRVETIPLDLDVYVGVDAGCLFLLEQGLELTLAVGDFDSVEPEEFQSIQSAAHALRTSVAEKNDTDLELAIKEVLEGWPQADIPVLGTHAHALVQVYGDDYKAFKAYAETHRNCVFLVDTYDTLRIGVPAAIQVAREMGDRINFLGVRIDSGDIAYISKKVRQQLDEASFTEAKIYASNDLDENTILNLKMQKAKIDVWGVGTKLITAYDQPALGAVYKIVAIEDDNGQMRNTIKLSNNAEKVSTPGKKQVWRITSREKGKSEGDYITYDGVDVNELTEIKMFHPTYTYIKKTVRDFDAIPLLVDIFKDGKLVYELPALMDIQSYARKEFDKLWDEYKRVLNPQHYPVDLAKDVWQDKMDLIDLMRQKALGGEEE